MPKHYFTIGGSVVKGTCIKPDGSVADFGGTLRNAYVGDNKYSKASVAARRKYADQTIAITEISAEKHRYFVDVDELLKIATEIKD